MIARGAQGLTPTLQRGLITVCVMMATIMQALDITIANVALPYMQGSLSATLDQVSWVLTSYIVAAAIMTAPVGWLAGRFGIKQVLVTCATGFTAASMLCGIARTMRDGHRRHQPGLEPRPAVVALDLDPHRHALDHASELAGDDVPRHQGKLSPC